MLYPQFRGPCPYPYLGTICGMRKCNVCVCVILMRRQPCYWITCERLHYFENQNGRNWRKRSRQRMDLARVCCGRVWLYRRISLVVQHFLTTNMDVKACCAWVWCKDRRGDLQEKSSWTQKSPLDLKFKISNYSMKGLCGLSLSLSTNFCARKMPRLPSFPIADSFFKFQFFFLNLNMGMVPQTDVSPNTSNFNFFLLFPSHSVWLCAERQQQDGWSHADGSIQGRTGLWWCCYNCRHSKNCVLIPDLVCSQMALFLHGFMWLENHEIGLVPFVWNFLVGHNRVDENDPTTVPKVYIRRLEGLGLRAEELWFCSSLGEGNGGVQNEDGLA